MARQRLGISDIDEAGEQLECILEASARSQAALHPESKDAGCLAVHVLLYQGVVLVVG